MTTFKGVAGPTSALGSLLGGGRLSLSTPGLGMKSSQSTYPVSEAK